MTRWRALLVAAATALSVVACGAGAAPPGAARIEAPATGEAAANVTIADTAFSPADVTITVGESVAWRWDDGDVRHDVVFDDGPASPLQSDGTWQRTFDEPGTYRYHCSPHPHMTGRVTVVEA